MIIPLILRAGQSFSLYAGRSKFVSARVAVAREKNLE